MLRRPQYADSKNSQFQVLYDKVCGQEQMFNPFFEMSNE